MDKDEFWENIDISDDESCWEWKRCKTVFGYGRVIFNGVHNFAHRLSWFLTNGEIPEGLFVLHKCDNPHCCNPNHLFLGTKKDNSDDMIRKGRDRKNPNFGEEHWKNKLTEEDVLYIRKNYKRGVVTQKMLAEMFSVKRESIRDILQGKIWKHLPGAKRTTKLGQPSNKEKELVSC